MYIQIQHWKFYCLLRYFPWKRTEIPANLIGIVINANQWKTCFWIWLTVHTKSMNKLLHFYANNTIDFKFIILGPLASIQRWNAAHCHQENDSSHCASFCKEIEKVKVIDSRKESPQFLSTLFFFSTKTPSEVEVARRYTLLILLTLFLHCLNYSNWFSL